jgi:thioredoxin-like negative regulator of GroEL
VAEALHGVAKVAAVNCEQQQGLCQEHGVRGYPTIMALRCAGPAAPAQQVLEMDARLAQRQLRAARQPAPFLRLPP